MTVTLTPEQLDLVLSEEFLAAIDPDYHDHFLVKLREGTNGNYAAVDFGPGSRVVIAALRQFAFGPDSPADKQRSFARAGCWSSSKGGARCAVGSAYAIVREQA
jgi:hypothetical protein